MIEDWAGGSSPARLLYAGDHMAEEDWRLRGRQGYLTGVALTRQAWRESRPAWDHDHCEFCGVKFGDARLPEALHEGWTTTDEYHWICDGCFADFRERFKWRIQPCS